MLTLLTYVHVGNKEDNQENAAPGRKPLCKKHIAVPSSLAIYEAAAELRHMDVVNADIAGAIIGHKQYKALFAQTSSQIKLSGTI